jgi:hypothetical protein
VLVHNAGVGVGLAALDICLHLEATTYGTASVGKHSLIDRTVGDVWCIDGHGFNHGTLIPVSQTDRADTSVQPVAVDECQ